MHELSIALSLLDAAAEEADRQPGSRVAALHLRLGPLSGIVGKALRSAYELAREGTALAGADLIIEETTVVIYCPACACEQPAVSPQDMRCAVCSTISGQITRGRELEFIALELET